MGWAALPLILLLFPSPAGGSAHMLRLFRSAPAGRPALVAPWLALGGGAHALSSRAALRPRQRETARARVRLSGAVARPKDPAREYRGVTDRSKPKRKACLHLGFLGSRYRGFLYQNEDLPTVERELLRALNAWGAISDDNAKLPSKVNWSRASRTDKGVHAIGVLNYDYDALLTLCLPAVLSAWS
jgi:hypothetical protein